MHRTLIIAALVTMAFACGSSEGSGSSGSNSGGTSSGGSSSGGSSSGGSTSGEDPGCADCGQCGIAGPNNQDFVALAAVGTTPEGQAALGLQLERKDTCKGQGKPFILTFADGKATLAERDASMTITTSTATFAPGAGLYTWNDRDLTMRSERPATGIAFIFTSASKETTVTCTIDPTTLHCE